MGWVSGCDGLILFFLCFKSVTFFGSQNFGIMASVFDHDPTINHLEVKITKDGDVVGIKVCHRPPQCSPGLKLG
jgi:hypothetical protein